MFYLILSVYNKFAVFNVHTRVECYKNQLQIRSKCECQYQLSLTVIAIAPYMHCQKKKAKWWFKCYARRMNSIKYKIFADWSSASRLPRDPSTERCTGLRASNKTRARWKWNELNWNYDKFTITIIISYSYTHRLRFMPTQPLRLIANIHSLSFIQDLMPMLPLYLS